MHDSLRRSRRLIAISSWTLFVHLLHTCEGVVAISLARRLRRMRGIFLVIQVNGFREKKGLEVGNELETMEFTFAFLVDGEVK